MAATNYYLAWAELSVSSSVEYDVSKKEVRGNAERSIDKHVTLAGPRRKKDSSFDLALPLLVIQVR